MKNVPRLHFPSFLSAPLFHNNCRLFFRNNDLQAKTKKYLNKFEFAEEYVALYQKQRSILQQRARETDMQMKHVGIEKRRLLNIIHSILTANISDSNVIRQLSKISNFKINLFHILVSSNRKYHVSSPTKPVRRTDQRTESLQW